MITQFTMCFCRDVSATQGKIQMHLSFRRFGIGITQLTDERGFVSALSPRFSDIGANRARGPPDLVGQSKLFFGWKLSCEFEYLHRRFKSTFVDSQFFVINYSHL